MKHCPSNYSKLIIEESKFDRGEIRKMCENVRKNISTKLLEVLQSTTKHFLKPRDNILSIFNRKLNNLGCLFTLPFGSSNGFWTLSAEHVVHFGIIRKIKIHMILTDMHDSNSTLLKTVKGFELYFQEDSNVYSIGIEDGPGTTIEEFELEENEHICLVKGRSKLYVHQLCFITNKGRIFGPVGGNVGSQFSTVQYLNRQDQSDEVFHVQNMYLKGICAKQVKTREGSMVVSGVQFCLGIITDSSVIFDYSHRYLGSDDDAGNYSDDYGDGPPN
jgi:hypothetical protein